MGHLDHGSLSVTHILLCRAGYMLGFATHSSLSSFTHKRAMKFSDIGLRVTRWLLWHSDFTRFNFGRGCAPDPTQRDHDARPDSLVGCAGGYLSPFSTLLDDFGVDWSAHFSDASAACDINQVSITGTLQNCLLTLWTKKTAEVKNNLCNDTTKPKTVSVHDR